MYDVIGHWFYSKAQEQKAEQGVRHAAAMLRKRGVPVWLAVIMLCSTK